MSTPPNTTTTIVGISGSLRMASLNSALLRAAAELSAPGVALEIASIRDIPLYDGDLEEQHGIPAAVTALKDRIRRADGLLIVTPEYNGSIPGVLKNAIDWLSRPAKDIGAVFGARPVAMMGATPGRGGTTMAHAAWLPILRALGVRPWFGPRLMISGADQVFDRGAAVPGAIVDPKLREQLAAFMAGFAEFIGPRE